MKALKPFIIFTLIITLFSSCVVEGVSTDYNTIEQRVSLNQILSSHELWYVDINETIGTGETSFLQIAFTVSFKNGTLYANNNLVGIGTQGNGYGIPIGYYDTNNMVLDTDHDIDGYDSFDVYQIDSNTIELYNPFNDTSYFLNGYQRLNFDYDFVFYDNVHYFMQEYEAWEKTYTSNFGVLNEFDNENFLQFIAGGNDSTFRSSQDIPNTNPNNLFWDFTGDYGVGNISGNMYLKTLTLNYDFFDNEFFELNIIDDQTVEFLHVNSGTVYQFRGRGYIQYLRNGTTLDKTKSSLQKKRKQRTPKKENKRNNTRV